MTAAAERGRFSLEGIQQSRNGRALAGVVLAGVVAAVVWAIVSAFTGTFTNVARIRAELPAGSNAVPIASPVEYRNVTVGKVGSETAGPNGSIQVQFEIYPKNLAEIPRGVQAQVAPLSIFGNQYVNLVPPASTTGAHLEASDVIAPYGGAPSSSLQGTVTQLYNLLNAIHPAQLDTALTAFAQALNGEGTALGNTLSGSAKYLGTGVVPNLGPLQSDLSLLTPVNDELNHSAPAVLGTLSNSATTAQTITQQESDLRGLLTNGTAGVSKFANDVLKQVQATLPVLINDSGPLLADITQNPRELAQTLSGLTTFASAVAAQEQAGPFLSVNVPLPVADISAGVNAALGYGNPASIDAALGSAINPPTYTSANCPEYPGETNPYCGKGGSPDAAPAGNAPGTVTPLSVGARSVSSGSGSSGSTTAGSNPADALVSASSQDPSAAEMQAVVAIATALNGGRPPASPALATMILAPLLASMAGL